MFRRKESQAGERVDGGGGSEEAGERRTGEHDFWRTTESDPQPTVMPRMRVLLRVDANGCPIAGFQVVVGPGPDASGYVEMRRDTMSVSVKPRPPPPSVLTVEVEAVALLGILRLQYDSYVVLASSACFCGTVLGDPVYGVTAVQCIPCKAGACFNERAPPGSAAEDVIEKLEHYLSTAGLYFSFNRDLSARVSGAPTSRPGVSPWAKVDQRFCWNFSLAGHFVRNGAGAWVPPVIMGFFGGVEVPPGQGGLACTISLIARRDVRHSGSRSVARGAIPSGACANQVEIDQVLEKGGQEACVYSIVRGSAPIAWSMRRSGLKTQLVTDDNLSTRVLKEHLTEVGKEWGRIAVLNLLERSSDEGILADAFENGLRLLKNNESTNSLVPMTGDKGLTAYRSFAFNSSCRGKDYEDMYRIVCRLLGSPGSSGSNVVFDPGCTVLECTPASGWTGVKKSQTGVIRVNCMDCLDRTNIVQHLLAKYSASAAAVLLGICSNHRMHAKLDMVHRQLWSVCGDNLARQYAGTSGSSARLLLGSEGSNSSESSKKGLFGGVFSDASRMVARTYLDMKTAVGGEGERDVCSNILLGHHQLNMAEIDNLVRRKLRSEFQSYSSPIPFRAIVGTWNVNAKRPSTGAAAIQDWLRVESVSGSPVDVVVVCLQEMLDLNAANVMLGSSESGEAARRFLKKSLKGGKADEEDVLAVEWWANTTLEALGAEYTVVCRKQLVGLALIMCVRKKWVSWQPASFLSSELKVGLGGVAGNKGAIGVSFSVGSTRVAFVNSHLAAHQGAVAARNKDFTQIYHGLRFVPPSASGVDGRSIGLCDHDVLVWAGDLNYRIDLSRDEVASSVRTGLLDPLRAADQLLCVRVRGDAWADWCEAELNFPPTYKYDFGTDRYDTSEKARVPAWCDRVLWRSQCVSCLSYNRRDGGHYRCSDHRPVCAVLEVGAWQEDRAKRMDTELTLQNNVREEVRSGRPAAPARRPPPPPKASAPQAEDTLVSLIDVDHPSRPAPSRPKSGDGPPVRAAPPVPKAPEVTGGLLDLGAPMDQVQGTGTVVPSTASDMMMFDTSSKNAAASLTASFGDMDVFGASAAAPGANLQDPFGSTATSQNADVSGFETTNFFAQSSSFGEGAFPTGSSAGFASSGGDVQANSLGFGGSSSTADALPANQGFDAFGSSFGGSNTGFSTSFDGSGVTAGGFGAGFQGESSAGGANFGEMGFGIPTQSRSAEPVGFGQGSFGGTGMLGSTSTEFPQAVSAAPQQKAMPVAGPQKSAGANAALQLLQSDGMLSGSTLSNAKAEAKPDPFADLLG